VPQSIALSEADLTVLNASLSRMVKRAFGALATLPLFCVGELDSNDLPQLIRDHHEAWHSFLIVARETLSSAGIDSDGPELKAIAELLDAADVLRDSYLRLATCRTLPSQNVKAAYEQLAGAYARIPMCIKTIAGSFDLEASALMEPTRVSIASAHRSLARFAQDLQTITGFQWLEEIHGSERQESA
jgi:hypothetical protein